MKLNARQVTCHTLTILSKIIGLLPLTAFQPLRERGIQEKNKVRLKRKE